MREHKLSFSPGEHLYEAGDVAGSVYLIESGTVDLFVEGNKLPVRSALPGEVLGILAIMSNGRFIRTAVAREHVIVDVITRQRFVGYLEANPEAWMQVLAAINQDATHAISALSHLRFANGEGTKQPRMPH